MGNYFIELQLMNYDELGSAIHLAIYFTNFNNNIYIFLIYYKYFISMSMLIFCYFA